MTLILDVYDGTGSLVMFGNAILAPAVELNDPTDAMFITPAPIQVPFGETNTSPQVSLLACDNENITPSGWTWTISFVGVPGNPAGFSFLLDYANGATQYLSAQASVEPVIPSAPYLPMPSGTPTAGYVPVVISTDSPATEWQPASQSGGAVASVFGRTGTVVAEAGDYTAAQVGADASGAAAAAQAAAETYAASQASAAQSAAEAASVPRSGATMGGYLAPDAVPLSFGSAIAVNAALGNAFNLTLTASTGTISNPTNPVDGQVIRFRITQGTGGSFTVAWGSAYDFGAASAPTLSTTASKVDIVAFEYIASLSKWAYLGSGLGY